MIGAIAILAGSIFKSGIGFGNFLFEAFVEFEQSSGVGLVCRGEPDGAGREQEEIARGNSQATPVVVAAK